MTKGGRRHRCMTWVGRGWGGMMPVQCLLRFDGLRATLRLAPRQAGVNQVCRCGGQRDPTQVPGAWRNSARRFTTHRVGDDFCVSLLNTNSGSSRHYSETRRAHSHHRTPFRPPKSRKCEESRLGCGCGPPSIKYQHFKILVDEDVECESPFSGIPITRRPDRADS